MSILIIDTSYLIYKAYFAYPDLSYQNQPTGAIYGFIKTVLKLITDWQPKILVFTVDRPEKTWRHELFSEYKAGRPEMEDKMLRQIPIILEWCQAITPNYLAVSGFEADDLIWTITQQFYQNKTDTANQIDDLFLENHTPTWIFSADRDLYQLLVFPQVKFIHSQTGTNGYSTFTTHEFFEKYQIQPQQWLDYKVLVGDPSDNLAGIPGIGPKTATKILQQIDHLADLFNFLQIPHQLTNPDLTTNPGSLEKVAQFLNNPKNRPLVAKIISYQTTLEQTYLLASLRKVPGVKLSLTTFNLDFGQPILEKYNFQSLLPNKQNLKSQITLQSSLF